MGPGRSTRPAALGVGGGMNAIDSKGLPSNLIAERYVLGSVTRDGTKFDLVETLGSDDFSTEAHRRIFGAMKNRHDRGEHIDRHTVVTELLQRGELDAAGGLTYLISLDDGMPEILHLDQYIRILQRYSVLRRLAHLGNAIIQQAALTEDPAKIIDSLESNLLCLHAETEQRDSRIQLGHELMVDVVNTARQHKAIFEKTGNPVMGIKTGIDKLDNYLGGLQAQLYLLGGGPGVGKTTLSVQIALEACLQEFPVFYVTYENSAANLIQKAICARANVSPRDLDRGTTHRDQFENFTRCASELAPALARLSVIEGTVSLRMAEVRSKILRAMSALPGGTACLVIFDYLQRAAMAQGYTEIRNNVSALVASLRDLCRQLNSPVLALSSLNRNSKYSGADLDSLKESGDLEFTADVVIFEVRNEERIAVAPAVAIDLKIAKQRFGPEGVSVPLIFRPDIGLFREESQQKEFSAAAGGRAGR